MELEKGKKSKGSIGNPQGKMKVTKILPRKGESSEKAGNSSSFDMRSAINSEPFIPKGPQVVLSEEDSNRTQFKPQIKILPREKNERQSNSSVGSGNSEGRGFGKTLEEREAKYNEARKRILGSPCSSTGTGSSGTTPAASPGDVTAGHTRPPSNHPSNGLSRTSGNSVRPPLLGDYPASLRSATVPTVRNPIGPDGASRGFKR